MARIFIRNAEFPIFFATYYCPFTCLLAATVSIADRSQLPLPSPDRPPYSFQATKPTNRQYLRLTETLIYDFFRLENCERFGRA